MESLGDRGAGLGPISVCPSSKEPSQSSLLAGPPGYPTDVAPCSSAETLTAILYLRKGGAGGRGVSRVPQALTPMATLPNWGGK